MKEEKAKNLRKNELNDSEVDQVTGGVGFHFVKRTIECPLCNKMRSEEEMVFRTINGEGKTICIYCARGL